MDQVLEQLKKGLPSRYTIESEIGRGGMATVYRALEDHPHRAVAIKVLSPELATYVMRERFIREINVVSTLTHPHIVPVFSAGDADGLLYYVMPLIEGESLAHRLSREKPLPVHLALKIAQEVASGLHYAHEAGVIHRDIKPANILLQDNHALIADFGVARAVANYEDTQLTQAGLALGTPAYMSPEQWNSSGDVDRTSDLYSLGCVLVEALGGSPGGVSPAERITLVPEIVRAAAGPDQTTGGLTSALQRALALEPKDRFQSASAFADALNRSDPSRLAITVPIRKRAPTKMGLVFLLAVIVLAVFVGSMLPFGGSTTETVQPRVVVAAFENQTGNPELTPLGTMAADWITQGMAQTGLVKVLGNLSVLASAAGGGATDIQAVAEQTDADVVVSGRYYQQGATIQFQGQVTDVREQTLLSALDPVMAPIDSPLVAVEELRQRVLGAMAVNFDDRFNTWADVTTKPPAYDAYLEYMAGMTLFMQELDGENSVPRLLRAWEIDTSFVSALLFAAFASTTGGGWDLADSLGQVADERRDRLIPLDRHTLDWVLNMTSGSYPAALGAIREAAVAAPSSEVFTLVAMTAMAVNRPQEAIDALEDINPEKGLMRGFFLHWTHKTTALHMLGDYRRELTEARRGLERYPGNPFMPVNVARALAALGRVDEARAMLGDHPMPPPVHWVAAGEDAWIVALELASHGHAEAAQEIHEWAYDWFESLPDETMAEHLYRHGYARTLYVTGRYDEAESEFLQLARMIPDSVAYRGYIGSIAARRGDEDRAMQMLESLETLQRPFRFGAIEYWQARIAAVLDDKDLAVNKLRQAFDAGFQFSDYVLRDEDLKLLRGYEPYEELMRPKG